MNTRRPGGALKEMSRQIYELEIGAFSLRQKICWK